MAQEDLSAFPSSVREEGGEILVSYEPGNGNQPRYPFEGGNADKRLAAHNAVNLPHDPLPTYEGHVPAEEAAEAPTQVTDVVSPKSEVDSTRFTNIGSRVTGATGVYVKGRERVLGR